MGKHYVPQHYLRGFEDPAKPGMIWMYRKGGEKPVYVPIKSVAQEKGYYSDDVERWLTEKIENPVNPIINKLRKGIMLSRREKISVACYMCVMMTRVPAHKERIEKMRPEVTELVLSFLENEIDEMKKQNPENGDACKQAEREIEDLRKRYERKLPEEITREAEKPVVILGVVKAIARMKWILYRIQGPSYLIITDNPFFYFECYGLGDKRVEITFPITKDLCLWLKPDAPLDEGIYFGNEKITRQFNQRLVTTATRFVFYHRDESWLQPFVNKRRQLENLSRIV